MKIRIVNAEFWAMDDKPEDFATHPEVIAAVNEFLTVAESAGLNYTAEDIEVVMDNSNVVVFSQFLIDVEHASCLPVSLMGIFTTMNNMVPAS